MSNRKALNFLKNYLNTSSASGHEKRGQRLWLDYILPFVDEHLIDNYGTAVGIINPAAPYKVVIEAHADEISWMVNYITPEGMLYVIRNGGSDHLIAPSMRVNIHTDNGIVEAVFGWAAIHTRRDQDQEETPSLKNIFLDCGCNSKSEVEELGIYPGCIATFQAEFKIMNKRFYVAKSLDNKAGGFVIAEVARRLKENKICLPFGLYVVNAVQEEVGLNGATMIARRIKPDLAIITDVTHDTQTPMMDKILQGDISCGKGPVISYAPSVQQNLHRLITATALRENIPIQLKAKSPSTGTDTDAFAYANGGTVAALVSLPMRYMHTTVEMVHVSDVENVIRLIYQTLVNLKPDHDYRYDLI